MLKAVSSRLWDGIANALIRTDAWVRKQTRPLRSGVLRTAADLFRSRQELIAENALLRTQLLVLKRHVTRPKFKPRERTLMVLLSRFARFHRSRPHQGIGQRVPAGAPQFADKDTPIVSSPILGGLHHEYRRLA